MRIPFSWLKEFVEIPDTPEEAAQKLQRVGVPVERVEVLSPGITRVVAGKIVEMKPHPNADKLRVAQVSVRAETLQIVTGAPNVNEGDVVPVALVGAKLAGGKTILEAKLRGLPSFGMMCSADELALGIKEFLPPQQQVGVMILDPATEPGIDLSAMLGLNESILILEPFANRPDYLSVFGIAREASAIYRSPLKFPDLFSEPEGDLGDKIRVEIQDLQSCSRYIARYVSGVKVRPSPLWMAIRLHASGVRPVNNIVDITNYVLLELGQPLHAFDYSRIRQKNILVRKAAPGESLKAIDDKSYTLAESMLVIADGEKPVALAGIMGGKESEIGETTSEILLESANFDPGTIRRASIALGLRTESSRRFEKGLDPVAADWGSRRACMLFSRFGCSVSPGAEDKGKKTPPAREIGISLTRIKNIIGVEDLGRKEVGQILEGLGFSILKEEPFLVHSPSLRNDIHEEIDVVEEVARHYGYDRIPSALPGGVTTPAKMDRGEAFEKKLRSLLQSLGLVEIITYSLGDPEVYDKLHLRSLALIQNPLTEDRKSLRPLLYPGLLSTIRKNLSVKNKDLSIFEIGKVFKKGEEISEKRHVCIALSGRLPWETSSSFFVVKGILENIWERLHIQEPFQLKGETKPAFHPHRYAAVQHLGKPVGFMGELHPLILESLEISQPVFILEISVDKFQSLEKPVPRYKPLPLYPESRRDISMSMVPVNQEDEEIPVGEILDLVRTEGGDLVEQVKVFDVAEALINGNKGKNVAFSVFYRDRSRTLTDEEVNQLHETIRQNIKESLSKKGINVLFRGTDDLAATIAIVRKTF